LRNLWNLLRNKTVEASCIHGNKCYLKQFVPEDAGDLSNLMLSNRDYWSNFEPRHVPAYYSTLTQRSRISDSVRLHREGKEFYCGIYELETNILIGLISLYNVKPLPYASCSIGYAMDEQATKKGIATEAIGLISRYAFQTFKVNRIEAQVSPRNIGSIRALEKNQFQQEGLLKQLLFINGKWQDHYLYAIVAEQFFQTN
jgi:[ribosomal protein S5]-alanine N-acetyltransferase